MDKTIEEKEQCLHNFLLSRLSDELKDAEAYCCYAFKAKHADNHTLSALLISLAKDELRHFETLFDNIEKSIPDIKMNPLYPLLEHLEEWADEIEKEIAAFR